MEETKTNFGSKLGAILAAAGSAVGLGNVWRFPTETGANGGAAFILLYIFFILVLGVPVMATELAIGRYGQKNVSHSFFAMSGGRRLWGYMGLLPVVAGVLILSYYAVVAGWTLDYAYEAAVNSFDGKSPDDIKDYFFTFSSHPLKPLLWLALILLITLGIVTSGVQKGIERAARIMMPVLFACLAVLVVCSLTLPGAAVGVEFLFKPDFSKVTTGVVLSAMAQAFFSLSVGICCLCTYGCYFRKDVDLVKDSVSVASIDTVVAVMSGLIVFPAVYSVSGLKPDAGPSLVFITLPNVFQQVFASVPLLGYVFSLAFYLLLVMAALTSAISMLEMSAAIFIRKFRIARPVACSAVTAVCFALGACCSLSFGQWSGVTLAGLGFFDLFDFLVAKLLMPLGALVMCLFVGWVVDERVLRAEIDNGGTLRQPLYPAYRFIVRWLAPLLITVIFVSELGII